MGEKSDECNQPSRKATARELTQKAADQQYLCALSGMPITPETASLDHIKARVREIDDSIENLQWLHTEINRMKGTLEEPWFIELCRKIVETADRKGLGSPPANS